MNGSFARERATRFTRPPVCVSGPGSTSCTRPACGGSPARARAPRPHDLPPPVVRRLAVPTERPGPEVDREIAPHVAPIHEVALDHVPEVAERDDEVAVPLRGGDLHDVLGGGPVADLDHGFGAEARLLGQPRAEAAGQDDGLHGPPGGPVWERRATDVEPRCDRARAGAREGGRASTVWERARP